MASPSQADLHHLHLPRLGVIPDLGLPGADLSADLEEEPRAAFRFVRPGIDQARRRIILRRVRNFLCAAKQLNHMEIVGAQLAQHILRRHELSIIILDRLVASDIPDRSNGCVARLPGALGDRISGGKDLSGLLIEEQVIVPEVGSGDMPTNLTAIVNARLTCLSTLAARL